MDMQGYNRHRAYIIAEGPMMTTVRNMCKVLSDNKCGAVIMLSDLIENDKVQSPLGSVLRVVVLLKDFYRGSVQLAAKPAACMESRPKYYRPEAEYQHLCKYPLL